MNDDGVGSFRQAILDSNANTTDALDTIQFDSSLTGQAITLTSMVSVSDAAGKAVQITGLGQSNFTITGGNSTGLLQFNTSTIINDLKLGSASSDHIIMPGTSCLTLANLMIEGSLTVNGSVTSSCISSTGTITATGGGSVSLTGRNVDIRAGISTQSGNITLTGDNGSQQSGDFIGIHLNGSNASLTTTGGSITLKGRGGNHQAYHQAGVCISQGSLFAGGSGCITIEGTSGNVSAGLAEGVCITDATLKTVNGQINITGASCGSSAQDWGVFIYSSVFLANGTGSIRIDGTSGTGSFVETGARIGSSNLKTAGGCITLRIRPEITSGFQWAEGPPGSSTWVDSCRRQFSFSS